MDVKIDSDFLVKSLQQLVQINSVNPQLMQDAHGEEEIGKYIASALCKLKLDAKIEYLAPKRVNVTCLIKGVGSGPSLMINVHMDTVGTINMKDPFSARIADGKLYGRGSYDTKAGIAATLTMAKALVENNISLKGDLLLAFVADEEYASLGTERLLESYTTDSAIVLEPTNLDICLIHKGYGLFEFVTVGKAAHGGKAQEGIDANRHMGQIMAKLDILSEHLKQVKEHPLLGKPSMHIPTINGGSEPFTYAAECRLQLERRTLPGEKLETLLTEYQEIIDELSSQDNTFQAKLKTIMWRDPYNIDEGREIVVQLTDAIQQVTHTKPDYIAHSWWEDSGLTGKAGIDTVILGPKGKGLHTENEWVDLDSVAELANILFKVSLSYLQVSSS